MLAGCLAWNIILTYLGVYFGRHWRQIARGSRYIIIAFAKASAKSIAYTCSRKENLSSGSRLHRGKGIIALFIVLVLPVGCLVEKLRPKTGSKEFLAKDGRKLKLRAVRWEDLDALLEFINSLVEEGADIYMTTKTTRDAEADWLGRLLARIEKGEVIDCIGEVDNQVVAHAEVVKRAGIMSHVGDLGIGIRQGYRGVGIGRHVIQTLIDESRKAGLEILVLDVFDTNESAKALYRKMGFREIGRIPHAIRKQNRYIDLVRMVLEI